MMKFKYLIGVSLFIITLAVGCSSKRPCGKTCSRIEDGTTAQSLTNQGTTRTLYDIFEEQIQRNLERASFTGEEPVVNVISLSAGGEFGAFGAGFIVGWYELGSQTGGTIQKMPNFNVVTGVSTGSFLAPFVFLLSGDIEDDMQPKPGETTREERIKEDIIKLLVDVYSNGMEDSDVIEGWWASNLIKKKALFSKAPLRKLLKENLKQEYLEEIANQYSKHNRVLLIGVVNMDTGKFTVVNLTKVAASGLSGEEKQEIFIDTIMASSAIPVIFPVEFLDGDMYIDGGAREYVFFRDIEKDINEIYLKNGKTNVDKTFYMIVHGDYVISENCTPKSPIDIALRSMSIVLDNNLRVSVFYNAYLANNPLDTDDSYGKPDKPNPWKIKVLSAKDHQCQPSPAMSKLFDRVFTECLYKTGQQLGSNPKKNWIDDINELAKLVDESKRAEELVPSPPPGNYPVCKP